MNVLGQEKRLRVLAGLVDGNSERAVERMTGVNRLTVSRWAVRFGEGALRLHNRLARDLSCSHVAVDEIWAYCKKKQSRVIDTDPPEIGEAYTFVALDINSRFVISFYVGRRNEISTKIFVADLRSRLVVMPIITSDGFVPYVDAVGESFGASVDYAQTVKNYTGRRRRDDHRYEPPRDPFITKKIIFGAPHLAKASTAYVERNNGTMRHVIGRMRRLSYAFSKKIEHHKAAVALAYVHYNFCHVVKTLRVTPAMQLGVTDHVWTLEEFMDVILAEPEGAAPVAKPLVHTTPETTHRELPGDRGFLRVVPSPSAE